MKQVIHPEFVQSTVICVCGNSFQTMSTKPILKVDVCSKCHPFFTGLQRILDSAGRVERFRKRFSLDDEHSQERFSQDERSREHVNRGDE